MKIKYLTNLSLLAVFMAFGMASCSKEESLISNKKTTEWDGTVTSEDYECEYVLEPAPTSLL